MHKLMIAILAAAGFASMATAAQVAAGRPDEKAASSTQNRTEERVICVREQITGSRLIRRICKTEREWQADGFLEQVR